VHVSDWKWPPLASLRHQRERMEPADMTSRRRMRSLAGMADSQRKHKRPETHGRREPG